jgi:hypothetical protein
MRRVAIRLAAMRSRQLDGHTHPSLAGAPWHPGACRTRRVQREINGRSPAVAEGSPPSWVLELDRNAEHRIGTGHVDDSRIPRRRARVTVSEQILDRAQVVRVAIGEGSCRMTQLMAISQARCYFHDETSQLSGWSYERNRMTIALNRVRQPWFRARQSGPKMTRPLRPKS